MKQSTANMTPAKNTPIRHVALALRRNMRTLYQRIGAMQAFLMTHRAQNPATANPAPAAFRTLFGPRHGAGKAPHIFEKNFFFVLTQRTCRTIFGI
jgi:hypothetical protein